MAFFKGEETYSIDSKGRVNIPSKMRKSLDAEADETFVLTRGLDTCVYAFPLNIWKKKYEEKFEMLNQFDEKNRFFLRTVLMWSEEVVLDSQSRIMLPKKLTDFAKIDKKTRIIGMGDHIEFWNPEINDEYIQKSNKSYEEIAEQVMS